MKNQINEYFKRISELEDQIKKYEKSDNKSKKVIADLKETEKELKENIRKLEKKIKEQEKEIDNSNIIISNQDEKINNQSSTIESLNDEMVSLHNMMNNTSTMYSDLQKIVEEKDLLLKQKEDIISSYKNQEEQISRLERIEKYILNIVMDKSATLENLVTILNKRGLDTNIEEVHQAILKLKTKFNIVGSIDSIPRSYRVSPINYRTDMLINVNAENKKGIDFLLISDEHVDNEQYWTLEKFDAIYNYCISNNIFTIIHLGDLFDFNSEYNNVSDRFNHYEKSIKMFLRRYPQDSNIVNAFLGGNHEKRMLICGIDPIEYIAEKRCDFTPLGYTRAFLSINDEKIGLHHPNEISQYDIKDEVLKYLKDSYDKFKFDRKEVCLDIFGHYHKFYLNQEKKLLLLPSFNYTSEEVNGACHLKIYLDEKGVITNISVIPLPIINKKLIPLGEMEYKRILNRKENQ